MLPGEAGESGFEGVPLARGETFRQGARARASVFADPFLDDFEDARQADVADLVDGSPDDHGTRSEASDRTQIALAFIVPQASLGFVHAGQPPGHLTGPVPP